MATDATPVPGDQSGVLSWPAFIGLLVDCGVPNAMQFERSSVLRGESGLDHLQRAVVLSAIRRIDATLPRELLQSIDTIGEAFEWCRDGMVREEQGPGMKTAKPTKPVRTVRLRSLRQDDVPDLYEGLMRPERAFRWRYRGTMPGLQQFGQDLLDGSTFVQMVVELSDDSRPVGLLQAYQANLQSGTCYFAFARADGRKDGLGEMTIGLYGFLDYLFRAFPLRKVYAEIPGFNWPQFSSGEGTFFEVESVLRDHDYWDERYWDLRVIAIARERWHQIRDMWSVTFAGLLQAIPEAEPNRPF